MKSDYVLAMDAVAMESDAKNSEIIILKRNNYMK